MKIGSPIREGKKEKIAFPRMLMFTLIPSHFGCRSVLYYFEVNSMSLNPISLPPKVKIRDVSTD